MSLHASASPSRSTQIKRVINKEQMRVPEKDVPRTLSDAVIVFVRHPTVIGVLIGLSGMAAYRLSLPWTFQDPIVALSMVFLWIFQEWFLHKYALHSKADWFGRRIHVDHHKRPYHHICIDGPALVFGTMLLSAVILKTGFWNQPMGDTAVFAYWLMGLMYIWCHYLVHTRYVPQNGFLKTIRRNHMRHHCKDSRYWFSFTCPMIDQVLRITPTSNF